MRMQKKNDRSDADLLSGLSATDDSSAFDVDMPESKDTSQPLSAVASDSTEGVFDHVDIQPEIVTQAPVSENSMEIAAFDVQEEEANVTVENPTVARALPQEAKVQKKSFGKRVLGFFGLGKSDDMRGADDMPVYAASSSKGAVAEEVAAVQNDIVMPSFDSPKDVHDMAGVDHMSDDFLSATPAAPINLTARQTIGNGDVITSAEDAEILKRVKATQAQVKKDSVLGQALVMTARPETSLTHEVADAVDPVKKTAKTAEEETKKKQTMVVSDAAPILEAIAAPVVPEEIIEEDIVIEELGADSPTLLEMPGVLDDLSAAASDDSAAANDIENYRAALDEISEDAPAAMASATPKADIHVWQAKKGKDLKHVLTRWSVVENVELDWAAKKDYTLNKDIFVSGTFDNALDILFSRGVQSPPEYDLSLSPEYVLRIID